MLWVEVEDWSFLSFDCESSINGTKLHLAGKCFKDHRFVDGSYIITSRIISSNGRSVVTENGTQYFLKGDPSKYWVEDQEVLGHEINTNNPLESFFSREGNSRI